MTNLFLTFVAILLLQPSGLISQTTSGMRDWARGAVWYQIFPDRFENGDTTNDAKTNDALMEENSGWNVSPWTTNWFQLSDWEKKRSGNFYVNAFQRSYGGDLAGIQQRLDYLSELGVDALLLNPIFESSSFHRYDINAYHHVDPRIGTSSKLDSLYLVREKPDDPKTWYFTSTDRTFLDLIKEVHRRKMKIVVEIVLHHGGYHFFAFDDVIKNQEKSPYASWFRILSWDRTETPKVNEFSYQKAYGMSVFPVYHQDSTGFNVGLKNYLSAVARRWMDPNADGNPEDGIDGWKVIAPAEIGQRFWRDWTDEIQRINPDAVVIAGDWDRRTQIPGSILHEDFSLVREALPLLLDSSSSAPSIFDSRMNDLGGLSVDSDVSLLPVDNHETDRLVSMLVNNLKLFDASNSPLENPKYEVRKPEQREVERQQVMILLQFTYPGSPLIYYGDETGMWGGDDPDCRKPMLWFDKIFDRENAFALNADTTSFVNEFDSTLYRYYRKLIQLKKKHLALRFGRLQTLILDDAKMVYAFKREAGSDQCFVVFNFNLEPQEISVPLTNLEYGAKLFDPMKNLTFVSERNSLLLLMPPKSATIFFPVK